MTDPFATPDPQAPQEPTPVYDSANPAGIAPQAPQPNEPAPVLYGESVTFTEMSTPAPNPSPAYGAPADPSAAAFSAPAYSAPVDPNTAAFNAPVYGGAPAASDPNAAAFNAVLLQCLFSRLISIFPQCGRMVFPGLVIMQSVM